MCFSPKLSELNSEFDFHPKSKTDYMDDCYFVNK